MKFIFLLIACLLYNLSLHAQSFEGQVIYHNTYKSSIPTVTDDRLTAMMGSTSTYSVKNGQYKNELNGSFVLWQLYNNAENRLYTKVSATDAALYTDAAINNNPVQGMQVRKNAATILGYKCDELILTCKDGIQLYYYSNKLPLNAKPFAKHNYGNWYAYLQKTGAVPLKMVIGSKQFSLESTAVAVKPMKLANSVFALPAGVSVMKSPY